MPPKTKKGAAAGRYKFARDYYKAACRPRIKELRDDWSKAQIEGTLAWLWRHASDDVIRNCEDLQKAKSYDLPTVDDNIIPEQSKVATDEAPVAEEPTATPSSDRGLEPAQARPPGISPDDDLPARLRKRRAMNTTSFTYMPPFTDLDDDLPVFCGVEKRLSSRREREWLDSGLRFPEQESEDITWHGVRLLGQGSGGRVGLWVATDENNTLTASLAVKDVLVDPHRLVSPIYWRDQLPREIAVQIRLDEVQAYDHNVHQYYGHRINLRNSRYRIFNEYCCLGAMDDVMRWYSMGWCVRRNLYQWRQMRLPEGPNRIRAFDAYREYKARGDGATPVMFTPDESDSNHESVERWQANLKANYDKMDALDNLEVYHDWEHDVVPEVIPESFIWKVFDKLADAYLMLHQGQADPVADWELPEDAGASAEDRELHWQEMIHQDGHFGNIFMKYIDGAHGEVDEGDENHENRRFAVTDAPFPILADFDMTFFDLATSDDDLKDNPLYHQFGGNASRVSGGARYAPETWRKFDRRNGQEPQRLSGKTDVWQLGSMMFRMVLNFVEGNYFNGPWLYMYDQRTSQWSKNLLLHLGAYTMEQLDAYMFSGQEPYEASDRYSPTLKDLIKHCLQYHPRDRLSMADVKAETSRYAGKDNPPLAHTSGGVLISVDKWTEAYEKGRSFNLDRDRGERKRKRQGE
ncbi:hypothetical protein T440DRAFT_522521 [Plenodomus tracheiphilus IPT5]|uniref:non-specific serine/threonine protein kinase n=1 Tax=Plenodomus tracheiphilus IPT5 TaxID=1408161 RepID=A0A6A7AU37_9PLEO|nr:hypothetical protein T440DRAFT_522521 [Plenodomus tracheiphilus IPT5]